MAGEELAQLVIHRLPGTRDDLRPYRVFVDGKPMTEISESGARTLRVEPGKHSICFKLDSWCSSSTIALDASSDRAAEVFCRSGSRSMYDIDMFRHHAYIQIGRTADVRSMLQAAAPRRDAVLWVRAAIGTYVISIILLAVFTPIGVAVGLPISLLMLVLVWIFSIPLRLRNSASYPSDRFRGESSTRAVRAKRRR